LLRIFIDKLKYYIIFLLKRSKPLIGDHHFYNINISVLEHS